MKNKRINLEICQKKANYQLYLDLQIYTEQLNTYMIYENTCYSRYSQTLELELRKHAESYLTSEIFNKIKTSRLI